MITKLILLPAAALVAAAAGWGDTIILKNGNSFRGTFVSGSQEELTFDLENGRRRRFRIHNVETVLFGNEEGLFPTGGASRVVDEPASSAIENKYRGMLAMLGPPSSEETATPDGSGRFRHYRDASIYWSPGTGAHEVHGAIRAKWAGMGWERSPLGYPTSDERTASDRVGKFNLFQNGAIYYSPQTGAYALYGGIGDKWKQLGAERSLLGYPQTDEKATPDGIGRFQHFQHGSIYWHSQTGAHEVHGAIKDHWASLGWERSSLGYPVSDTIRSGNGWYTNFQNGAIFWSPQTGARVENRRF